MKDFEKRMRWLTTLVMLLPVCVLAQQAEPLLFREKMHDFGEVSEDGVAVETDFTFTNNSGRAIKIISVQPSCGCTTPSWTKEVIPAGGTGSVKASFNPKGRPGFFSKSLTVTTDLEGGPMVLQIKGQVLEKNHVVTQADFPAEQGNLRFRLKSINFDKVFMNLPAATKEIPVYNGGEKPVHFVSKVAGPAYIRLDMPAVLDAHARGVIKVTYDAKMKGQFGFVSDNVEIGTDDDSTPLKSFPVYATIEEFFPTLSADDAAKAPVFRTDVLTLDLGRIHQGNTITRETAVRNTGKKELTIRAVQENCSCLKATVEATVIKPGATAKVSIAFNTTGRDGTQQKAVTFYTNDPKNPVQRITLTAYIEN